jgi:biopolymer transport protein TolQ
MLTMTVLLLQGVVHPSITGMVLHASPVAKLTLLLLLLLSVTSWAIIFQKYRSLRRVEKEARLFADVVRVSGALRELPAATATLRKSVPARIVARGLAHVLPPGTPTNPSFPAEVRLRRVGDVEVSSAENAMRRAIGEEVAEMESRLTFLATTGSVSPFIGLFGTVWGVMSAFLNMGVRGTAHLAVVGPGIAEALIATAAGLAAAIPAVIAYNYFVNQVKRIGDSLDRTASEVRDRIAAESTAGA